MFGMSEDELTYDATDPSWTSMPVPVVQRAWIAIEGQESIEVDFSVEPESGDFVVEIRDDGVMAVSVKD
jgi:hypothetical protein